ncbi:MAG: hypothetical protein AVO33_09445 [delta proteobacterium ML8_F1]|nr:MAG: hypothetical protein AVO33_09445 [delta proteobacterium ML8_F1]
MKERFPRLLIKYRQIAENAEKVVALCKNKGISVTGVVKGFNGIPEVAMALDEGGCEHLGSSRIEQLQAIKALDPLVKTMMVRIPMVSEAQAIVASADISLNSERATLAALDEAAMACETIHSVILMVDLGDLREGYMDSQELVETALWVEKELTHLNLMGIGTNVGCYGSVKPTRVNMNQLVAMAREVEKALGRKLEIVSGGATSSLTLVARDEMPEGINHLRIGEGIALNRDLPTLWDCHIEGLHKDNFILEGEIIEIKSKPTHPIGELFVDAFGHQNTYEDRGSRRRALLAMGRQDFLDHTSLESVHPGVEVVGSSSDHLIVDIEDYQDSLKVGDVLGFHLYYGAMLFTTGSAYVEKIVVRE